MNMDTITPRSVAGTTIFMFENRIRNMGYEDFSVLRELLGWGETINDQHPRVRETFRILSGV